MMKMISLEVDDKKAQRFLRARVRRSRDARRMLLKFQHYIIARIGLQFHKLRKGGKFRGVFWADLQGRPGVRSLPGISTRGGAFGGYRTGVFSDVATRKIGGGERTTGKYTLGALRPSGKRVTAESAVMHDTGTLLRKAGKWIKRLTRNEILFGTNLIYAGRQDSMRRFMFFELPKDLTEARRLCVMHFQGK